MTNIPRMALAIAAMAPLLACGETAGKSAPQSPANPGGPTQEQPPPPGLHFIARDLSRLDGPGSITDAQVLDDTGAVAGSICDEAPLCTSMRWDLFLWDGTVRRFRVEDGTRALVSATAAGRIGGTLLKADGSQRAFLSAGSDLIELPTLGGDSFVLAMNASGLAVGASFTPSGERHAVVWKDGGMIDLGTRTGMPDSMAMDVDETDKVAVLACGQAAAPTGPCHAMTVMDSNVLDLGAIPEQLSTVAMRAQGSVVGSLTSAVAQHAAVWRAGQTTDLDGQVSARPWPALGAISGSQLESLLRAVAASGDAVGAVAIPISEGAAATAILWKDGTLFDLAAIVTPSLRLHSAVAINSQGQILARTSQQGFEQVLLTPQ